MEMVLAYKPSAVQDRDRYQPPAMLPALQPGGGSLHLLLPSIAVRNQALRGSPLLVERRDGRTPLGACSGSVGRS